MWISNFSIRNPVPTTVLMLAFVVFGAIALALLDVDEFPNVQPPVVDVTVPYPGASSTTTEREVVDVLEDALTSISGVDRVRSTAQDSLAVIIVEFLFEKDLQQARSAKAARPRASARCSRASWSRSRSPCCSCT